MITAPRLEGGGPTDLAAGIERLGGVMRRRGLAVVISDWLDPTPWQMPLRRLAVRHEVLAVEVLDPRELALAERRACSNWSIPRRATCTRCRPPTPSFASGYAAAAAEQRAAIARQIRGAGTDHLVLRTDEDWLLDLVRFVVSRRRNRQSVAPTIVVT